MLSTHTDTKSELKKNKRMGGLIIQGILKWNMFFISFNCQIVLMQEKVNIFNKF